MDVSIAARAEITCFFQPLGYHAALAGAGLPTGRTKKSFYQMQDISMFHNRFLHTAMLLAGLALSAPAFSNPYEMTLDNGLKIIVKEDHRAPSVVHMVWYGVGAVDEPEGVSGIAHMLEHMMFKGTEKIGPGEFNKRVAAVGGRDNAFTSSDYTAYYQQVPPSHLEEMMMLEADRMANLKITEELFLPEREVVSEERRLRTEDNPHALLFEQLRAAAFQAHPYRRPIIGWMADIAAYKVEDARAWHKNWYTPSNARLVVVGDVDHQQVFEMARRHYGAIAPRELPARRITAEPQQRGQRGVTLRAPAELPFLVLAWQVPGLKDPVNDRDPYALEVLSAVLDGFDGARLSRHLVREQQIAVSAGAGYDGGPNRGPSLFIFSGSPSEGHSVAELEAALRAEITRIQEHGISEAELKRVKTQTIASQVYKRDSLMGQAMEIGVLESNGYSWRDDEVLLEGIRRVTAEEVQAVAKRYFGDDTLTRAELIPAPPGADAAPQSN